MEAQQEYTRNTRTTVLCLLCVRVVCVLRKQYCRDKPESLLISAASNSQQPNRCRRESTLHLRGEGEGLRDEQNREEKEGSWEKDFQWDDGL